MAKQTDTEQPQSPLPRSGGLWTSLLTWAGFGTRPTGDESPVPKRNRNRPGAPAEDDDKNLTTLEREYAKRVKTEKSRLEKYKLYRELDTGLMSSLLDAVAEEVTQPDYDTGRTLWVESKDGKIKQQVDVCLRNIQAEDRATPIVRDMAKFGDRWQRLLYRSGEGVLGWKSAEPDAMVRFDDEFDRLIGFTENGRAGKYRGRNYKISWPWDYSHFRLLGKDENTGYGTAYQDATYRSQVQMQLAEDAMLMYRLRRQPDRNLIGLPQGDLSEDEAAERRNRLKNVLKRSTYINPATAEYRTEFNPITPFEDVIVDMYDGDEKLTVDTLSGSGDIGDIYDLNYYVQKFFGESRAPKTYFGYGDGDAQGNRSINQLDIRWARMLAKIRKYFVYGIRTVADIHLVLTKTTQPLQAAPYLLQMSPISYLAEIERIELMRSRLEIVSTFAQLGETMKIQSDDWVYYVLTQFAKIEGSKVEKLLARAKQQQAQNPPPEESAGGSGIRPDTDAGRALVAEALASSPVLSESIFRLRKIMGVVAESEVTTSTVLGQIDASVVPPSFMTADGSFHTATPHPSDSEAVTLMEHIAEQTRTEDDDETLVEG